MKNFVIEDGVLKNYTGPGGDIVIPAGVTEIGELAFEGGSNLTLRTPAGSYAEQYAKKHNIPVVTE